MKQISVFDADACIFMGRPISNGLSLLSEVLEIFDENYMHKTVFSEIKKTNNIADAKTHLQALEQQRFIEILDDSLLLDMLYEELNQSEESACRYFCDSLNNNIQRMTISKKNELLSFYINILEKKYLCRTELTTELSNIEKNLPNATSIGEVKTCVLVDILDFLSLSEINFFVSNDKEARKLLVQSSSGKISTSSPMGTFVLLRDVGISKSIAEQYFKNTPPKTKLKVLDQNGKEVTIDNEIIFNDIYDEQKNITLTSIGLLHY